MLRDGGNACDAALCAAMTQTVVEPHMTTITGMLSLLYHDAPSASTDYLNGNVNAPLARLDDFGEADIIGGRGVAVPGWWAAFEAAHERFGLPSAPPPHAAGDRPRPRGVPDPSVPVR